MQSPKVPKNWCLPTVVLEKPLESPLDNKIKPVNHKGNQSWIFIGRTDAEAVAPILWPPDVKNWLIWKDPDAGKDWRQKEKGMTEDEMVGWYHWLDGHEFEQVLGVGDREAWQAAVHEVAKSQTQLSDWTEQRKVCGLDKGFEAQGKVKGIVCCVVLASCRWLCVCVYMH